MNKKGFTLIELLAVIVVLAIIALIVTPIISKIVTNATNQANMRSLEGHIGNVNNNLALKMLTRNYMADGTYVFSDFGFSNYPAGDLIRCENYTLESNRVVEASTCMINDKSYCFGTQGAYACDAENLNVGLLISNKASQIRSTGNTDISGRTGPIYYISADGNNDSDGLTPETAWKTMTPVRSKFATKEIPSHSTILFRRGDTFTSYTTITQADITFGSYGDESLPKPVISGSIYDGRVDGVWTEVKPNIWKYTVANINPYKKDVGQIVFFCNDDSNLCDKEIDAVSEKFTLGKKITTNANVEETEDMLPNILKNDLEFYHMGHPETETNVGTGLYLYSVGNPKTRFKNIKFSYGYPALKVGTNNNIVVDNLDFRYYGVSAVYSSAVANLTVTNCEMSFIGGAVTGHDADGNPIKGYGDGVTLNGYITDRTNYPVEKGLYVHNNYMYELYGAGINVTNAATASGMIKAAEISDNIVEYANDFLRFTSYTTSTSSTDQGNTFLGNIYVKNNVSKNVGYGISEERQGNQAAFIYTGPATGSKFNYISPDGEFIIENNVFDTTKEGIPVLDVTGLSSLPEFKNNKILNYSNRMFGYYYLSDKVRTSISLTGLNEFESLITNKVTLYDNPTVTSTARNDSGKSGNTNWNYNKKTKTLSITGSGAMADYTEANLPKWHDYANDIQTIEIGESVTSLGKYAFYGLSKVRNINLNATGLGNMTTNNYTFYNVGMETVGVTLKVGSNVTSIPNNFTYAKTDANNNSSVNITKVVFEGNNLTTIGDYALSHIYVDYMVLPNSVTTLGTGAFEHNKPMKVLTLSNNVATIPSSLVNGSTSLETVIFGEGVTTVEDGALFGCPNLESIVIPSLFTSTGDFLDSYSETIGLDIWAPAEVEALVLAKNDSNLHYFPITNYRPIVFGDKEEYTVEFDELFFNGSTTVTIKTLGNFDATYKGAKYRYRDRFGNIYIIDGAEFNGTTLSNVRMDAYVEADITNRNTCTTPTQTVLFIGNSLSTGFGRGMASSDNKSDYIYQVMKYINSMNPNSESIRFRANPFENATTSADRNQIVEDMLVTVESQRNKSKPIKTIILQFGTNVASDAERATFIEDTTYMINRLKQTYPGARMYWIYSIGNPTTLELVRQSIELNNLKFIDATYLRSGGARYLSYIGAKYVNGNKRSRVTDQGVADHPGDYGFTCMANTVVQALKDDNYCASF